MLQTGQLRPVWPWVFLCRDKLLLEANSFPQSGHSFLIFPQENGSDTPTESSDKYSEPVEVGEGEREEEEEEEKLRSNTSDCGGGAGVDLARLSWRMV